MKADIVILIDDNPTTLFYNEDVINEIYPNVEVVTYENSEKALNNFLELKYNDKNILMFLDINMPDYTGYEMLAEIDDEIEDIDNLKVVMLTSSKMKSDTEKATRFTQIIGYIEKPLTVDKIKATIK